MAAHSIISPSSAKVWSACTAYPTFSAPYQTDEDSPASKEGTAAHELGEALIRYALAVPGTVISEVRESFIGQTASNGEVWNEEMFDGATLYANTILDEVRKYPKAIFGLEERFHAPSVHKESFGTIDAFLYDEESGTIKVWDYKFGFGQVEAYENLQMINYVTGIMDTYQIVDMDVNVTMTIVQPRGYHRDGKVRPWTVKGDELRRHVNLLHNKAQEALSDNTMCLTGSHCRYCETRHDCEAAHKFAMEMYEIAMKPIRLDMSFGDMSIQLDMVNRAIEQLGFLKTAYEERISNELRRGGYVAGWTLSPKLGNREWNVSSNQIANLGKMMGVDLVKPMSILTPAQAIKKGLDKETVNSLSERKQGSVQLVKKEDSVASRIFNKKGK
jgi:hypothetical protein